MLPDKIRISRKGAGALFTHGFKGDKEIFIKYISSIQFKKAGLIINGYIQFAFLGGQESKSGLYSAVQDENTIVFNSYQQKDFEEIKAMIESKMATTENNNSSIDKNLEDLERLANLKQKGILTEEEFQLKKEQILRL